MKRMRKQKGFSLIELLIVVAIILIIAAIAIPNLLRSRIAANEASAVGSLRTLNTAQITYNVTYPQTGFASSLTALGPITGGGSASSSSAGLIDAQLAGTSGTTSTKSGYNFTITPGTGTPTPDYEFHNQPQTAGVTGQRGFCTDPSGVIEQFPQGTTVPTTVATCQAASGGGPI